MRRLVYQYSTQSMCSTQHKASQTEEDVEFFGDLEGRLVRSGHGGKKGLSWSCPRTMKFGSGKQTPVYGDALDENEVRSIVRRGEENGIPNTENQVT